MALEYSLLTTGIAKKKGQGRKEGQDGEILNRKGVDETGQMWLQSERKKQAAPWRKKYKLLPIQLKLVVYVSLFRFHEKIALVLFYVCTQKKSDFQLHV